MSTVRPSGAGDEAVGTAEKVNGGAILNGGSNAAGIMTKSLSLADVADDFGESFGSKVVANDGAGTDKAGTTTARGAGTLAYNATATQWVVQGGNVTTKLNNAANTALISAAADSEGANATRDNITSNVNRKKIGATEIDVYAKPSTAYNGFVTRTGAGTNQLFTTGHSTETATDDAANPTLAVPGELTYMAGGKNPTTDEYKAKNAPEA